MRDTSLSSCSCHKEHQTENIAFDSFDRGIYPTNLQQFEPSVLCDAISERVYLLGG